MIVGTLGPKRLAFYSVKLICFLLCCRALPLLAIAVPKVTASPANVSFGNQAQATTSAATTVTLSNSQNAVLTISNIRINGNYAIASNGCGTTVAAYGSCNVTVTFTPAGLGNRNGTLTFVDNFSSSPQTVALTGTGVVPVGVAPTSLAFGSQAVGLPSAVKTVTLTNNLDTPLSLTSAATTGDYAVAGNTCGTFVPARSACTVGVTLSPTTTGSRPGTLRFTDSASNSPQIVNLTGSGVVPVTTTPANLAFGKQAVGSTSPGKTVTLTNNENITLNLAVTASGNYGIAANTCGTTVPPNTACTLTMTFTPAATGSQTGTLMFTDSASNSPQKVTLSGTGVVPVAVSPATLGFGNQLVTTPSATKTVTLTNNNTVPLNITGVATPGDYFIQSNSCGATVAATSSCTLTVAFQPKTLGARPGTLAFTDDANNSPQTVNLAGTGTTTGITSIVVSPTNSTVSKGAPQQFAVAGNRSSGSPLTLTNAVTWSSSTATVATIGSTGLASTLAAGTTTIKAVLGTFNNSTTLTVGGAALSGIVVTPANPSVPLGQTQQFTATGNYTDGTTKNLTSTATWSSSAPAIATVNAAGLATNVAQGTTTISASAGGFSGTAGLTVTSTQPIIASLSPTSGEAGITVTISGSNFGSQTGYISCSGYSGVVLTWTNTQITATLPAVSPCPVTVILPNGVSSNSISFTLLLPNVTRVTPNSGSPGTSVTITGSFFGP